MSEIKTVKNQSVIKEIASTTWTVIELAVRSVPILLYYLVIGIIFILPFILSFIPVLIAGIGIHNKRRN